MPTNQGHPLGVTDTPEPRSARQTINEMLDAGLLDELMDRVDAGELTLTGEGGFLPEMVKAVLERGLAAELTEHLGYERGDPAGRGSPNSRNGVDPEDAGHRGRAGAAGHAAGPAGQLRAAAGAQGCPPRRRAGRDDRVAVRGRDDRARHLPPSGPHAGDGAVPRHHLHDHRRGVGGGQGLADPAAGGALPDPLPGRPGDQGPGRAPGPQPGRAPGRRGRPGRGQARARDLGPGHRGGEVLGRGVRRAAQPRRA